jgi:TPR repeat protein
MDSRSAGWFCRRTGAACLYSDLRKDLIIGESWLLRRAALAGDPQAATLMGDLCIRSGPLPPNYTETSWYSRAAEEGHQAATRALASLYLTRLSRQRGRRRARRAGGGGLAPGRRGVAGGSIYVSANADRGSRHAVRSQDGTRLVPESGMSDAQVALAEMMLNGRGGPASAAAALDLFKKAAAKGHAGAMFALGVVHAGGHGMPANRQIAQR